MTDSNAPTDKADAPDDYDIGYGKPPRQHQFPKGKSGNPRGRPKRPEGVSIRELLDTSQRGKNGSTVSTREALVIRLLNDAMSGKQKAFSKFLHLMQLSGLLRKEVPLRSSVIVVPRRPEDRPSPKVLAAWLRSEGRHEEADKIDPKPDV
ncbi:hypothetical protein IVB45_09650 [Bradyrhizobium sp. 4]|uniref:DUF5681 domain-containing protein n=1 Tax=unclassified Bradyrhizobium TaxID=2631580 RepID=UPI001FFA91F5|nr:MULTISPECIES: DUF5681 domain-containing protein [unclassified Bradyrhizobium]MCK1397087.1 hypothetical protein [Bradyrhizobium sp. 39]MCK1752875.1 hypothetical protein [Bradyrhizobium sp. 135]UPJ37072.1 hypothetical protein IVB45_09650 [Bradyrhizobium sp. 4]